MYNYCIGKVITHNCSHWHYSHRKTSISIRWKEIQRILPLLQISSCIKNFILLKHDRKILFLWKNYIFILNSFLSFCYTAHYTISIFTNRAVTRQSNPVSNCLESYEKTKARNGGWIWLMKSSNFKKLVVLLFLYCVKENLQ